MNLNKIIKKNYCKLNKLYYGLNGRCLIYSSNKVRLILRNSSYGLLFLSVSNSALAVIEKMNPLLGKTYFYFFSTSSIFCSFFLIILIIYSKRIIFKMEILKGVTKVNLETFNLMGNNKNQLIDIKDFSEKKMSLLGFTKFDIVDKGFYWINEYENDFYHNEVYRKYIENILSGKELPEYQIKKRIKKFNKF